MHREWMSTCCNECVFLRILKELDVLYSFRYWDDMNGNVSSPGYISVSSAFKIWTTVPSQALTPVVYKICMWQPYWQGSQSWPNILNVYFCMIEALKKIYNLHKQNTNQIYLLTLFDCLHPSCILWQPNLQLQHHKGLVSLEDKCWLINAWLCCKLRSGFKSCASKLCGDLHCRNQKGCLLSASLEYSLKSQYSLTQMRIVACNPLFLWCLWASPVWPKFLSSTDHYCIFSDSSFFSHKTQWAAKTLHTQLHTQLHTHQILIEDSKSVHLLMQVVLFCL